MIEHIEIENFKSLQKVSLDLGPLNIFVGTNASGKTNFLEALRVLQGIGYGYTVDEIFNGKPKGANSEVWEGIRGGSKYARFVGATHDVHFGVKATFPSSGDFEYALSISPTESRFTAERLAFDDGEVVTFPDEDLAKDGSSGSYSIALHDLGDLQWLLPSARAQREYSTASRAVRMGDHAENFAALLKTILSDDVKGADYLSWLKELTPAELDGIEILTNPDGAFTFAFRKGDVNYPARVLSDGTLRFAAIAAAFFQPSPPRLLLLEEIEEGLHPTRLQLLVELLKSQTGHGVEQVFATSHSPYAIAWLNEEDYKHVFLCTKNEETGASTITPFSEVPHLIEVARRHPISDLFVQGWLETAV